MAKQRPEPTAQRRPLELPLKVRDGFRVQARLVRILGHPDIFAGCAYQS